MRRTCARADCCGLSMRRRCLSGRSRSRASRPYYSNPRRSRIKIKETARSAAIELHNLEIIDAPDSLESAKRAVALIREGGLKS